MSLGNCLVFTSGEKPAMAVRPVKSLPDVLKITPEGLFRSPYFFAGDDDADKAFAAMPREALELSGPMLVVHSIRRASDLLLEDCGYEGLSIQVEVDGKRLPELPDHEALLGLLAQEKTLVVVDGKAFRPNSEVFGFQQVYDDAIRFVDGLKNLGVPQDAMYIMATPDEIAIEVHPGILGAGPKKQLARMYRALITRIAGLKQVDRRLLKTTNRTIVPEAALADRRVLVPGAVHPNLHRSKVGVGTSHFAYGPAAFSDYCGKKRTLDECLKETKLWLKFLETPREANPKLKEFFAGLAAAPAEADSPAPVAAPRSSGGATTAADKPQTTTPSSGGASPRGSFRPLKQEFNDLLSGLPPLATAIPAAGAEFTRSLGGGFTPRGIHLFIGPREEGKSAFLLSQAMHLSQRWPILFLSRELSMAEFGLRLISWVTRQPAIDAVYKASGAGAEGQSARQKWQQVTGTAAAIIPESLHFRGLDSSVNLQSPDEITELQKLLPNAPGGRLIFLDAISSEDIPNGFLDQLRARAATHNFTVFISLHQPLAPSPRPHLIEGPDLELLQRWQRQVDTLCHLTTERLNLRKFLAIAQGKVEPPMVEKLEGQMYQAAGGAKLRQDTYTLARLLHSRTGSRRLMLYLFQREIGRFWEGPALPLSRP